MTFEELLRWMARFAGGKLKWSQEQFLEADMNYIWLCIDGYNDEWDDLTRLVVNANGGKYPDKAETIGEVLPKTDDIALGGFLRALAQASSSEQPN